MALLDRFDGYYDYNRRVLTELVREGYLKERRMLIEVPDQLLFQALSGADVNAPVAVGFKA